MTPNISSLAKFFLFISMGDMYLTDAMQGMDGNQKALFQNYANRIAFIKKDVYARMRNPDVLRTELDGKDLGTIDSILNIMLNMDEAQREQGELCLQAIADGELFLTLKND